MKKEKSNKISIYLIKDDVKYDEIIKESAYKHILTKTKNSTTYYLPTIVNKPNWLKTYFNDINIENIINARAKVISLHKLTIDGETKIFALPFGNGKSLLNDDVIEEQFGIKILLNSVSKDGFRQLSMSNYGGDHRTKNEQTPKKTDISEFGFDIYSDFLRKATAKSEEERFNKNTITGGDLFSVSIPVNNENVDEFISFCYRRYKSTKYKENFGWLDNIKEVKEKSKKELLNNELLKQINEHNYEKVWTAVPELIEWEKIREFRFKTTKDGYDDIELSDFIELFKSKTIQNIDILKHRKVYAISVDDNESLYEWSIYNCLIAEIELNEDAYCLNFGKWYKVNKDFVKSTNEYYNSIPICNTVFPASINEREDDYNIKLNKYLNNSILMDKKTIRVIGMGKSSIEVCDVFSNDKELIHVKKNGGSSYLSHLFNQAAVSGEALLDERFRLEVNKEMNKKIFDNNFSSNNYKIILGIITKNENTRPKIPFFSKVSIQYAIQGLKRKGYNVEIKNIVNIEEDKEKLYERSD